MPRASHFERFEEHTRLKHFLLDSYLKQWATILIPRLKRAGVRGPRLWFVDAFAGAGRDETGAPGSPVIAAKIAEQVNAEHFAVPLQPDEGMRVIAIEADARRFERLRTHMTSYTGPSVAIVWLGTLQQHLDSVLTHLGSDPAFFFLDPFGVDGLDASVLPALLRGPRSELLVLVSDEGAVRLHGKAEAQVPSREELLAARERDPSILGPDFDAQLEAADRRAVERVLAGHQSNARADEILERAFGGDWWKPTIRGTPADQRRRRFVDLYTELLLRNGATHVLRLAITTQAGRHKYTLLHASKHLRAFAAMKEAMHRTRRKRAPAAETLSLFGAATDVDVSSTEPELESGADLEAVVRDVARHFAGREVQWTEGGYTEDTVRGYARDETPLLLHEFDALKHALERHGYVVRPRPLTYRFPSA